MRWFYLLFFFGVLAGSAVAVHAQVAPAKATAPQGATHLMLPPVPKALLPESFAGWVATDPPRTIIASAMLTRLTPRSWMSTALPTGAGRLQTQRRNAHPPCDALS